MEKKKKIRVFKEKKKRILAGRGVTELDTTEAISSNSSSDVSGNLILVLKYYFIHGNFINN